jgi:vacuolar protein sorting-associated protein IST1
VAVHRFQISSNKKTNLIKAQKKEIAKLLQEKPAKEEKARIRAEGLIREDSNIEAYEILELMCDLLHERMRLIETTRECPGDLKSTVRMKVGGLLNHG